MMENFFNAYKKDPIFTGLVNNLKERYSDTASLGLIPNIDDMKDKNMKVFNAKMLD